MCTGGPGGPRLPGQSLPARHVRAERSPERVMAAVGDRVLVADGADLRREAEQVVVVHAGQEVVLDLQVQPAAQQERQVRAGRVVAGATISA